MGVSKAILEEIKKYNQINNYIFEQETGLPPVEDPLATPPAPADVPVAEPAPDAAATPPAGETAPQPVDVENDPDVEKIGGETEESGSEELEITDLVNSQKNIETKQEEYFSNLFNQLQNLESKLGDMDNVMNKLNQIETKIEKYREKTPQEKLELRSLDSGPFNQKLTDFFVDKQTDFEKSGKNEYVLTTDEVEDYAPSEIKGTFNDYDSKDDFKEIKF
jgi:hypothetical protein